MFVVIYELIVNNFARIARLIHRLAICGAKSMQRYKIIFLYPNLAAKIGTGVRNCFIFRTLTLQSRHDGRHFSASAEFVALQGIKFLTSTYVDSITNEHE